MIDCRLLGFGDGAQAVNYLGSHDVEGFRNERLFNFLQNNGVWQTEERIKLAFACLLTAVGIPQILAGDEFADQHDLSVGNPAKQRDAVNYDRVDEPFRRRMFDYVARLVKLRTSEPALSVNETGFLHADFTGKRVMVWRRGLAGSTSQVVVVANFSDFGTDTGVPGAEYRRTQLACHARRSPLARGHAGPRRAKRVGGAGANLSVGSEGLCVAAGRELTLSAGPVTSPYPFSSQPFRYVRVRYSFASFRFGNDSDLPSNSSVSPGKCAATLPISTASVSGPA